MGTMITIRAWAGTEQGQIDELTLSVRKAYDRIAALEQIFSDYRRDSEVSKLASAPSEEPIPVGTELFDLFQKSRELYDNTAGAFDITLGPLIRQWRLSRKNHRLPSKESFDRARARSGFHLVVLNAENQTILKKVDGMIFDFGGIGKGYAADAALKILREEGYPRSLVAVSGDIALGDPPPGKKLWRVGIESLQLVEDSSDLQTISIANASVSTSGDTQQYVAIEGKRYSHILDPETGLGLTERIGVSVIAPNTTTSDSFATAVSILGEKEGLKFIENKRGIECQIVTLRDGRETIIRTDGFIEDSQLEAKKE